MNNLQFKIYWVDLSPTIGSEQNGVRPCVIISNDKVNKHLKTVIIAPLTSTIKNYPTRIDCVVSNKAGQIVLDQIRTVDKVRLKNQIDELDTKTAGAVVNALKILFS
ncbi:type II toxin-antitoxin system PemK/MazF family toxin [Solitalea koreensis]|uniref:mRNA interferase n=1 Tax=Solitalea koreensis TaxID=543615 RepID=A0A521D4F4_9SPHI|nr:type II toxin-antitoxin system PemK/MazF family toxin [Solitalea koreensis]SMO65770.1 transcriptional modulator of MazE/toxin, MazF [Solitalea koreensis]